MMKHVTSLMLLAALQVAKAGAVKVEVKNPLDVARASETVEIPAGQLGSLADADLATLHVQDAAGNGVLCQAVDSDGDAYHKKDTLIFQTNIGAGETQVFTVEAGKKQYHKAEQYRAYGRYVQERFGDFAWENDCVAFRTYGKPLETWVGEPLSSSSVDIWVKRTPRLVINEWYMTDDYHEDHGEGADLYSAGVSRGCGGSGIWSGGRLWVSRGFAESRQLANGPIRVSFELTYRPYEVNGVSVAEVKRVTLDAGQQFNHFASRYTVYALPGKAPEMAVAAGLKKAPGETLLARETKAALVKWEPISANSGNEGLAVVCDPASFVKLAADDLNDLLIMNMAEGTNASWWAGFAWDKAGKCDSPKAWSEQVEAWAQRLAKPLEVRVSY